MWKILKRLLNLCAVGVVVFSAMAGFIDKNFLVFLGPMLIGLVLVAAVNYVFFGKARIWHKVEE
jgi:hypothetical protein